MITAKQLADRLPQELLPKTKSCSALLSAVSQLKTDRNNALIRVKEFESALINIKKHQEIIGVSLAKRGAIWNIADKALTDT
jgi:hypothetical protein